MEKLPYASPSSASFAALSRRFVVPKAFVCPLLAEHTMATLWDCRYWGAMTCAIAGRNLPTEVPPYFCTIQGLLDDRTVVAPAPLLEDEPLGMSGPEGMWVLGGIALTDSALHSEPWSFLRSAR